MAMVNSLICMVELLVRETRTSSQGRDQTKVICCVASTTAFIREHGYDTRDIRYACANTWPPCEAHAG
jgi:hypothetical protein